MARKTVYGFNASVNDYLTAGGDFQQLMIQENTSGLKKYITGFDVNLVLPAGAFPVANTDMWSRVVIVTGGVDPEGAALTILDLSPFSAGQGFPKLQGATNVLFDQAFKNELHREFSIPLEIQEGEKVSILVGLPWVTGDNAVTPDGGVAYLSWSGFVGSRDTSFPYHLR